jgi:hypothetical protein
MITCHVKYIIDPYQLSEFENYASKWIEIVELMGGIHHGYFLPSEGANNIVPTETGTHPVTGRARWSGRGCRAGAKRFSGR